MSKSVVVGMLEVTWMVITGSLASDRVTSPLPPPPFVWREGWLRGRWEGGEMEKGGGSGVVPIALIAIQFSRVGGGGRVTRSGDK